jgi:hypothetical protein
MVDLMVLCQKHNLVFVPQPTMVLSMVAERLYANQPKSKFAVISNNNEVKLVEYNDLADLESARQTYDFIMTIEPDGSGIIFGRGGE